MVLQLGPAACALPVLRLVGAPGQLPLTQVLIRNGVCRCQPASGRAAETVAGGWEGVSGPPAAVLLSAEVRRREQHRLVLAPLQVLLAHLRACWVLRQQQLVQCSVR